MYEYQRCIYIKSNKLTSTVVLNTSMSIIYCEQRCISVHVKINQTGMCILKQTPQKYSQTCHVYGKQCMHSYTTHYRLVLTT